MASSWCPAIVAGFAFLGALATTGLYFAGDGRWLLAAVLFVVSTGYQRENAYVAVHHYWRQDPRRYFAAFDALRQARPAIRTNSLSMCGPGTRIRTSTPRSAASESASTPTASDAAQVARMS